MLYYYALANGMVRWIVRKKPLPLEELQKMVGGNIEFADEGTVCCNEEGLLIGLPRNKVHPKFVGNIIFGRTVNGEFIGL